MSRSERITFNRSLRGFLGYARLGGRSVERVAPILSPDPIEPIDAVFTQVPDEHADHNTPHYQAIVQQLLASEVLDSLIRMQNEMLTYYAEPESVNAKAANAYQHVQENFPERNPHALYHAS